MKRIVFVCACLVVCGVSCVSEDVPREAVLFDFEAGTEGWFGNPWKGGKCLLETTSHARFGRQALHGWYEGTPDTDGGNIVSPELPADAEWRKREWGAISIWLKGDGSPSSVRLILEEDAQEHPTFSKGIPLDSREWKRFCFSLRSFWNRGKRTFSPARFKRLYFAGTPSQSFLVDRIALEAPHRYTPLERTDENGELPFDGPVVMEYAPGYYGVRMIPPVKPHEKSAEVKLAVAPEGGERVEKQFRISLEQGADELIVPFKTTIRADSQITLAIRARGVSGREYSARYTFQAFVRRPFPESSYLAICPLPKEMKPGDGVFPITKKTQIVADGSPAEEMTYCVDLLQAEMRKWYGLHLGSRAQGEQENNILLKVKDIGLPPEGYVLSVKPNGVSIRGRNCRAVYYGVHTLLQAIADSTCSPRVPEVKCVEIRDWPALPMRSAMIVLPTDKWGYPNDADVKVEDFLDFLYSTMARYKYNMLILNMRQGYRYACAPKVGAEHAWGRQELENIREFCRRNFIEIVPNVNSMGHTSWLLYRYPELRWHDDINMLCTCNPESYKILTSVYDELIGIFHPRIFCIGMDEVRWKGNPKNPNPKRCECDDVPTWEQFGRWVRRLHDHLTKRGVRVMMWGDMLLSDHNGGPPFFTKRALPGIPRDIIIGNWSTAVAPESNFFLNKVCGFREVLQANSSGVNVDDSPYVTGNMFGMWSKCPWLSQRDMPGSQRFCYLGLVQGGEFSWNLNRTERDVSKRYDTQYLRSREESVLRALALVPEPHVATEMKPIDIRAAANCSVEHVPGGEATVSRITFQLMPEGKCVEVGPAASKAVPFVGKAVSLYFLHAEMLPSNEEKMKSFVDRWKAIENVWGIPVGRYEITYEDGTAGGIPIKHSWNILPGRMQRTLPYAYRVIGSRRLRGDAPERSNALYVAQWVNPHPQRLIKEIRVTCADKEPTLYLFAITARVAD